MSTKRVRSQTWLGHFATLISDSKDLSPNSQAINHKWKNIPDIVLSTNIAIKQQLLPTKAYEKYKLQEQVPTSIPVTSIENQHAKILWDVPLVLERRPSNNAIKPDMILFDKDAKKITMIEGTVCAPDIILTREDEKQQNYGEMRKSLEKMYQEYNFDKINVVFDFLACYSKQFYTKMEKLIENSKTTTSKTTSKLRDS